jgi:cephalosporin hydroxylase
MGLKELRDNIYRKRRSKSAFWRVFFLVKDFFFRKNRPAKDLRLEKNLNTPLRKILWAMRNTQDRSSYFGVWTMKSPLDFWVYRELVFDIKPDVIVEIGNWSGGITLAFAHILDHIGKGRVIGLDIDHNKVPQIVRDHPRITLITGDACESLPKVKGLIKDGEKVLIIEDSSHTYENTLNVLKAFSPLVTKGSYFIVEDSIIHHGVGSQTDKGPYAAIETFIRGNRDFEIDRSKEKFVITWNPKGYLKRVR